MEALTKESSYYHILNDANQIELKFKDKLLNKNNNYTFGIELEFLGILYHELEKYIKNGYFRIDIENDLYCYSNRYYRYKREYTNKREGAEIVTPIMMDKKSYWQDLKMVCEDLRMYGATGKNCSTHMHFGAHVFGNNYNNYATLVKLWVTYEKEIYNFYYGKDEKPRKKIEAFAPSINKKNLENYFSSSYKTFYLHKYQEDIENFLFGLNLTGVYDNKLKDKNTIEIRVPNGCLDYKIIQNNVSFFLNLIDKIKTNKIDIDYLDYKFKNRLVNDNIKSFNNINLNNVLDLVNIVYRDEVSKLYFIKQCYCLFNLENDVFSKKVRKITNK